MGTKELSMTPFINATTTISGLVYSEIIGKVVSIEVAPAGAIAVYPLRYFAKKGIERTVSISLKTLVRKAIAPISALCNLDNSMPDRLYQPKPDAIDKLKFILYLNNIPVNKPPKRLPMMIASGTSNIK